MKNKILFIYVIIKMNINYSNKDFFDSYWFLCEAKNKPL